MPSCRSASCSSAATSDVAAYHARLVDALRATLGDDLVAVYATGSFALGAYEPGRSDLDVIAIVSKPLDTNTKQRLVEALRHETIPCPARGLELVVYAEEAARTPTADPNYELDLNTGETMPFRASFDDSDADRHWYVIDRAITRDHGVPLVGPPAVEIFAEIPRPILLDALAASIEWHRAAGDRERSNAARNAARAVRFAEQGVWSSKAAVEWIDSDVTIDDFLLEALSRLRAAACAAP